MLKFLSALTETDAFFAANTLLAILGLILTLGDGVVEAVGALTRKKDPVPSDAPRRTSVLRIVSTYLTRAVLLAMAISILVSVNLIHHQMNSNREVTYLENGPAVYEALAADVNAAKTSILTTHVRNANVTLQAGKAYQAAVERWATAHSQGSVQRLVSTHGNYVDTVKRMLDFAKSNENKNYHVRGIEWPLERAPMNNMVIFDKQILYIVTYVRPNANDPLSQDLRAIRIKDPEVAKDFQAYFDLLWDDPATKPQEALAAPK